MAEVVPVVSAVAIEPMLIRWSLGAPVSVAPFDGILSFGHFQKQDGFRDPADV